MHTPAAYSLFVVVASRKADPNVEACVKRLFCCIDTADTQQFNIQPRYWIIHGKESSSRMTADMPAS